MERKKFFKILSTLIVTIFLLNLVASRLYWYSSVWWFDIPMHFLGGVFIGLSLMWFFFSKTSSENLFSSLSLELVIRFLLLILSIGIFWEIFEILVNYFFAQNPFNILDTVSDIFLDLAGGSFAMFYFLFYFSKEITQKDGNKLQL